MAKQKTPTLETVNTGAAAVDIGSREHMAAVNLDVTDVPGRKTDVSDASWLRQLPSYGLLRGSFRPTAQIATLRAYLRQRERLVEYAAAHIQHMQKALMEMNLQLHHVVSDITGVTGMRIIRAIVAGERDLDVLASYRDVHGLGPSLSLKLVGECGTDLRAWPSAKHFTSWLCLAPGNKISGGKVLSSRTRRSSSRAAALLRLAAVTLGRSDTALGAFYRRLAARAGKTKAVMATARKIAVLFYNTLRHGMTCKDPGASHYEERYRNRVLGNLKRRAKSFGYDLHELPADIDMAVSWVGDRVLRARVSVRYALIEAHRAEFSVRSMCRVLMVDLSGFYA